MACYARPNITVDMALAKGGAMEGRGDGVLYARMLGVRESIFHSSVRAANDYI